MKMEDLGQIFSGLGAAAVPIALIVGLGVGGWVLTTWLRIKNGYPLEGTWGQAMHPQASVETAERIKLLSQENAALRAELGSVKDRLAVVERIVTDEGNRLHHEISQLRRGAN